MAERMIRCTVGGLVGFQRITLNPGQSRTVTFTLNAHLGPYDNNGRFRLTPGPFDVWVGDSSVDNRLPSTFTLQ